MSKAEIVQRLIEESHITAEEAVILLSEQIHYHTPNYHTPNITKNPYDPPFEITCNTNER
jgi:hypothetical protein